MTAYVWAISGYASPENLDSFKHVLNYLATLMIRFTPTEQQILTWTKLPLSWPLDKRIDINSSIVHFCNVGVYCTPVFVRAFL